MKARFAPSPTGKIHLGNARTALFNALFSVKHKAPFLLRVEDTDAERSSEAHLEQLLKDLKWLGLHWQEGPEVKGPHEPYRQSQRAEHYDRYYAELEEKDLAYPCFCSEAHLALTRKTQRTAGQAPRYPGTCRHLSEEERQEKVAQGIKPTLRFKVPTGKTIVFEDIVRGRQSFEADDIGDFIIRRADGTASFMYCNAVDDAMMGVTHVLRGEDHLTNSPRQIMILDALGLQAPQYAHISIILGQDGAPLSKRNGSKSIQALREEGYLALALVNYLARLGHYYADNELLSFAQCAEKFELSALNKAAAKYDPAQLLHWQKLALAQASNSEIADYLTPHTTNLLPTEKQAAFYSLVRENIHFAHEVSTWEQAFFSPSLQYSDEAMQVIKDTPIETVDTIKRLLQDFDGNYEAFTTTLKEDHGIKGKGLFKPLRVVLTGCMQGPKLPDILALMDKDITIARFTQAQQTKAAQNA